MHRNKSPNYDLRPPSFRLSKLKHLIQNWAHLKMHIN